MRRSGEQISREIRVLRRQILAEIFPFFSPPAAAMDVKSLLSRTRRWRALLRRPLNWIPEAECRRDRLLGGGIVESRKKLIMLAG